MSERAATAGEVQTVLGPISPASLGLVLPHEHILCDVTPPELKAANLPEVDITLQNAHDVRYHWVKHYGNHILDDWRLAADELALFRDAGGGTIVDLTIAGIAPDPVGLKRAAEASRVNVVAGVGFYIEAFARDHIANRNVEALAEVMIRGVREGIDGTQVRAGIIGEIGVSDPWTDLEQRVMRAAVIAQQATGASINVHPGRDPDSPLAVARFVRAAGGDVTRLVISHLDRTYFEDDQAVHLMDEGCIAEWDFFGIESSYYPFSNIDLPNDGQRLSVIKRLVERGYGDRILMSHDICTKTRLVRFGGHGYAHLPHAVVPMMRRKGFSDGEIRQITEAAPRRILTKVAER